MTDRNTDDDSNQDCPGKRDSELCPASNTTTCPNGQGQSKGQKVDRDSWLNTKLLKIIGIVYGLASPFIVWLVVTIYGQTTEIAILKIKMDALKESMTAITAINSKLNTMNKKMGKMQLDITVIKTKGNIP